MTVNDTTVKFEIWCATRAAAACASASLCTPDSFPFAQGHCGAGAVSQPRADVLPRHVTRALRNARRSLTCFSKGAAAAIIVYDITNSDSFARAKSWVRRRAPPSTILPMPQRNAHAALDAQVRELQRQGNASLVMALTGNKADLADKRKVEAEVRAQR